jgi:glycosyltransferase involved in cell wall biosynthesis
MIIGIDGNEANVQKRVGISEYAYQLLLQFAEDRSARDKDIKFVIYLKDKPLDSLPKKNKHWQYRVLKPGKFWTQWRLPLDLYLRHPRPDIFFSMTHYAPRYSPVPTIISVMDVSYLRFPEMFKTSDLYQLQHWTQYSVKNAKKVLTISNSSRDDIINIYKKSQDDVLTIYPGIKHIQSLEPRIYGMNQIQTKYHVTDKFILFVGTLQPRKNIARLIEAFSRIKNADQEEKFKNLQLVIIGKKGWQYEEILAAPEKYDVTESVRFLENVPDVDLDVFYQHALCYVLPSLYEGFGLPVVEAMQRGCPVITSNISSLPEAGGDAAIYVNPEDVDDIAHKITKVITDEKLRHELKEKGKKQVMKFSWKKSAQQTLDILEEVAGKK